MRARRNESIAGRICQELIAGIESPDLRGKLVDNVDKSDRTGAKSGVSQVDKFKDAAREAECDEDEARWTERLKKVAKPEPKKPE